MSAPRTSPLKLRFEAELPFQLDAIAAVRDLFAGQRARPSEFTVVRPGSPERLQLGARTEHAAWTGLGNRLTLREPELLDNLRRVQVRNGLGRSEAIDLDDLNFTVEMETGTGKTYVYLRTIYELNRAYGLTKFIVVVPSIAIKEGVAKSLAITREHLGELYGNPPFHSFVYDSSSLGQVRGFATSPHIEVMLATIQSLHKTDLRLFHRPTEKLAGARPIDLIREVRPIVIVDEPQSVDGGDQGRGREALREMKPLCALRYSATHVNAHHMVYRLDAVDAYEQNLVKGIEVAAARLEGTHDRPFVRLVEVGRRGRSNLFARVELDAADATGQVSREVVTVHDGDDLERATRRAVYADVRVGEIVKQGKDHRLQLLLPGQEVWLEPGEVSGDVPVEALQRLMIRRTIRAHLDREMELRPRGIKVLSLFFVDAVRHYRSYDEQGQPVPGKYARMFEQEYLAAAGLPRYRALFEEVDPAEVARVHDGYFSIDKKRRWVDTSERNNSGRQAAEAAYSLIMTDKEKLLGLQTPLRFIFSHSALREGWDNPNVFQICSLREMSTERQRRQSIGRGLRLCVNQDGNRVRDPGINRLTVIASETVGRFAAKLQEEIEQETGLRFGVVERHAFANIPVAGSHPEPESFGARRSEALWAWLLDRGYVDRAGAVQQKLARELKSGEFALPEGYATERIVITRLLRKLSAGIVVTDADAGTRVRVRRDALTHPDLRVLWDRIKRRTAYQVEFDPEELVRLCVEELRGPRFLVGRARVSWTQASLTFDKAGVHAQAERQVATERSLGESRLPLPDVLTELQERTGLTRRTVARILTESDQLGRFENSPQAFIEAASEAICRVRRATRVEGVKYERVGGGDFFVQSLYERRELKARIAMSGPPSNRSCDEQVVDDSGSVQRRFAEQLGRAEAVRWFVELPPRFEIPTPSGTCDADWAVLVAVDGDETLYFVTDPPEDPT